jgi:alkylation response protein AidB-like acyl-CoA dehydrogenase
VSISKRQIATGGSFLDANVDSLEIFTPEDFTSEHKDIAKAVEEFVRGEIASRGEQIEVVNNQLSRDLMRKAGELGFLGMDIPEIYGGTELDFISSAVASEKFGYGAGSFAVTELNHTGIGTLPVVLFGTEDQKKKYLPKLSKGELIGAFGLTEPEAGSDALNPLTTATLSTDANYYILNGSKQFITNAGFADIIFTYAKVDGKDFTAFIVEQNWKGVSVDEEERKMGMHGTSTRAYHFDDVMVPVENVLGKVGKGHIVALNALNMGRYKVGLICIGSAKAAFFEALKYAKQRVQFGKPICQFGLIKEKISEIAIRLYAAESMMYRTAGLLQARLKKVEMRSPHAGIKTAEALEEYVVEFSINKIYGSETQAYAVDAEVQIFGGYGYIHGYHPELAYRNARINQIWEGTNEINRIVIVSTLLRKASKGTFDLAVYGPSIFEDLQRLRPVPQDQPENLNTQEALIRISKKVFKFVFTLAYQKYSNSLREEQQIVGLLSDMIIEIYALDSAYLRTKKLLLGKSRDKGTMPIKMTKVLFHKNIERICFLAKVALEAIEEGYSLAEHVQVIRTLLMPPSINTLRLREEISDKMIQNGCYAF